MINLFPSSQLKNIQTDRDDGRWMDGKQTETGDDYKDRLFHQQQVSSSSSSTLLFFTMMTKDNNNNNKHYYGSVSVAAPHTTQSNKNHVVLQEDEVTPLLTRTKINNQNDKQNKESLWSRLIFQWFDPILELGNKQQRLELHDLNLVSFPLDCQTKEIQSRFYYYWNLQLESARNTPTHTPSLLMALFQSFGRDFIMAGFLKLIHDLSLFVGPLVLNGLIYFLRDANAPLYQGLELTLTVTVSQVLMSFCLRHYFFHCYLTGLRIRSACVLAVYQKALRLHAAERQTRSTGEINNLLSIDAQRMQELTNYLHAIWYSFLQIGLALLFLWKQLGPSSLGGVAVICITIPITKYVAQWLGNIQKHLLKAKDQRVQLNAEVMTSIKIIKLQAWEEPFQQRLMTLRNNELQQLWNYIVAQAVSVLLWSTTPLAVALATFSAYILAGHKLEVASALVALALLDILRFPLFMLPQIVNRIVEANVSLHRIQSFLQSNEHYPHSHHQHDDENNRISMDQATFAHESRKPRLPGVDPDATTQELMDKQWEIQLLKAQLQEAERNIRHLEHVESTVEQQQQPIMQDETNLLCLKRINFHCQRGEFIAVVGGVGCGKSSFLNAILGEIRQLSGTTFVNGTLSLFSQTPFILNDTVKNNILFGHTNEPVNEELYQKCLSACALRHDLKLLPAGDATEIGEKGITLSGGQKARVALARVMYHNADLVLLDDPLAAVDAHVGKHLFHKCIVKELLQGGRDDGAIKRTVILVTNALQYLNNPMIDRILVFQNGRIVEEGSFEELSQGRDTLLSKFLAVMAETGVSPTVTQGCDTESMPGLSISGGEFSVNDEDTISLDDEDVNDEPAKKETSGALMTDEFKERVQGHVDKQVYIAWGRAAGGIWVPIVILLGYGLAEGINVLSKWFLTYWSHHGEEGHQIRFLGIYALINLSVVLTTCFRNMILMSCGLRASRVLFARLLSVVLQAPTSFFDTTPLGRIINRFSKDMNTVDQELVQTLRSYLMTLFSVFSTIVVISTITPIFTLCLIPILVFYAIQQAYFTVSYRELKRLDSVARSPIFALLGETLDGVATIRAFGAQGTLSERLNAMLDRQQHAFYLINAAQCWLGKSKYSRCMRRINEPRPTSPRIIINSHSS
jgi:ABC-type multidrug transport system fused ATPase/permease subunit